MSIRHASGPWGSQQSITRSALTRDSCKSFGSNREPMPPNMRDREYELVSIMQGIRRGEETHADVPTPCLTPIASFIRVRTLRVCVLEDVGPTPVSWIAHSTIDMAQDQRKNRRGRLENVSPTLHHACSCGEMAHRQLALRPCKTREHCRVTCDPRRALSTTRDGKAMGRGLDHFYEVGATARTRTLMTSIWRLRRSSGPTSTLVVCRRRSTTLP